ncbi:hypothetical protein SAMN02745116_02546 [Pilibacter termitis]|uniref:Uncharacterized protein n=1 Tax=Pilibacter termitis TaxID=263852 RepID=A0A1T4RCQ0_9ENTE|nr:hypothetical protein [Pilibacter termitis]SKA13812.1 hypothetical protein SAMN02745116_02546 [Pilibacter termitis]
MIEVKEELYEFPVVFKATGKEKFLAETFVGLMMKKGKIELCCFCDEEYMYFSNPKTGQIVRKFMAFDCLNEYEFTRYAEITFETIENFGVEKFIKKTKVEMKRIRKHLGELPKVKVVSKLDDN